MDRDVFDGLPQFLAVARNGSFSAAAKELGISPTAVSKTIRAVENRYQVKLFQRTTRHVRLTEAGAALFRRLDGPVTEIGEALQALSDTQTMPSGTLRLTVPRTSLRYAVEPVIERFQQLYPKVVLDISLNDSLVDLIADGFDAGVRLGQSIDKDMIAVRLAPAGRWAVAASPKYLDRAGRPTRLEDLPHHRAIIHRFPTSRAAYVWEFERDGKAVRIGMRQQLVVDDRMALLRLAKIGLGLAIVQELEVVDEVRDGELELFFADQLREDDGMFLYFPAGMQHQPKLRALINVVREQAAKHPRPASE